MKKHCLFIVLNLIPIFMLTGCLNFIPEMSEEDEAVVVRYMADEVLEHDAKHQDRLLDDEEMTQALKEEQKKTEQLKQIEEKEKQIKEEKEKANQPDETIPVDTTPKYQGIDDLNDFIGLEGVEFEYKDYFFKNQYPDDSNDFAFALTSQEGNKLLILEINACNVSGNELSLNLFDNNAKYRVIINNDKKSSAVWTPLENDLNNFEGVLKNEEVKTLVLVYEIPEDVDVSSLSLSVIYNDDSLKIQL